MQPFHHARNGADSPSGIRPDRQLDLGRSALLVCRRFFLTDTQPVALCEGYYPVDIAIGMAIARRRQIKDGGQVLMDTRQGRSTAGSLGGLRTRSPGCRTAATPRLWAPRRAYRWSWSLQHR
jgi:hypothetical protein